MPDPTPAERREWAEGLLTGTTPGPWIRDQMHVRGKHDAFVGSARGHTLDLQLADAALIAAAPDLAAAVRDLADENERLRAWKAEALAVLAQWDEVHAALGSPGRLGQSMAVASREQVERLRGELRDEVAFWDDFYDEAFTDEPFIWGRVRGEIDRRRAALTEEPQP